MIILPLLIPFYFFECNVEVPSASRDAPPVITIGSTDPNGKFSKSYTADAQVVVDQGTQLVFISSAFNSGGVKNLVLSISSLSQTFLRTSQPDAKGKVPKQLNILNDDAGNVIRVMLNNPGQTVKIEATSENYNFMQAKLTLNFTVAFPPPQVDYLKFIKRLPPNGNGEEDGYINLGQSTSILWNVLNCPPGCNITLTAKDGIGFTNTVFALNNLPAQGSHVVTPREQFTRYFLTASNTSGTVTKEVTQQIYIPH